MSSIERLLEHLRSNNVFAEMYQSGSSPADVKAQIVDTLRPFFRNLENLNRYTTDFLVADFVNFSRAKRKYPRIEFDIRLVLDTYTEAISKDSAALFATIKRLMPDIIESGNRFWTFVNLERDKSSLELPEFARESFSDIEGIVEGLLKVLLIEQVAVNRIVRRKTFDVAKLKAQKLGTLVDELLQSSPYPNLFTTEPEGLKFSVWRNIAAHHSYRIVNEAIVCDYQVSDQSKSFSLSRAELLNRINQIVRTLEVLNLAHKFFGFDNMEHLAVTTETRVAKRPGRDEIWLLFFATGLNSMGFEVMRLQFAKAGQALLVLRDLTQEDARSRGIHTSQFIYSFWLWTGSARITVEYRLKSGKPYLRSTSTSDVCESIRKGDHGIEYLAENVEFRLLDNS